MNWILLRGLMREADHWGDFYERLKNSTNVSRVRCLDLPGIGTETGRIFIPNISQVVQDLRSRFRADSANKTDQDWGILGVSLGGMIGMQWVHDYPGDFKKAVVINSSSREAPLWKRLKPESMGLLLKIFAEKDLQKREKHIIGMVSNLRKNDSALLEEWTSIAKRNKFLKLTAMNQLIAASQFKLPANLKSPLLVLASRADRMVDWECSKKIAEKYKAEIKIHPTSGHDLTTDDPAWVVQQISEWVKSNAS